MERYITVLKSKKVGFDGLENFKQYNYKTNRFKVLIDFDKKFVQSKDLYFSENIPLVV